MTKIPNFWPRWVESLAIAAVGVVIGLVAVFILMRVL